MVDDIEKWFDKHLGFEHRGHFSGKLAVRFF